MRRRVVFTRLRDWWTCPRACCTTPRQRATPLPPSPPPVRYFIGSTDRPLTRATRWRCGPVTLPVAPTEPTRAPCLMPMPTLAAIADMCAYSDDSPPPWEMVTCLPYGPPLVADLTVPLSTATNFVPPPGGGGGAPRAGGEVEPGVPAARPHAALHTEPGPVRSVHRLDPRAGALGDVLAADVVDRPVDEADRRTGHHPRPRALVGAEPAGDAGLDGLERLLRQVRESAADDVGALTEGFADATGDAGPDAGQTGAHS